jgi:hypothetical protein
MRAPETGWVDFSFIDINLISQMYQINLITFTNRLKYFWCFQCCEMDVMLPIARGNAKKINQINPFKSAKERASDKH